MHSKHTCIHMTRIHTFLKTHRLNKEIEERERNLKEGGRENSAMEESMEQRVSAEADGE